MKDSGSALVEALIAAAIVMLSLSTMYQAVVDGIRRVHAGENRSTALLVAQSELAAVGSLIPANPGRTNGTEGPYAWSVDVRNADEGGRLVAVTVSVGEQQGPAPLVTLRTLRLSDAP